MPVLLYAETWKWLAEISLLDDAAMLTAAQRFLTVAFDQAFEAIRSQKVLSRSRSDGVTKSCCLELATWTKESSLKAKNKRQLIRHCQATVAFQTMMSAIRDRTNVLDIWQLNFLDFSLILMGSVEATNLAFHEKMADQAQASEHLVDFLELNSTRSWLLRATLDGAQLVLNEGRKRCARTSDFQVGSPGAFVQSLRLAWETTEVMLAWDHYTFGRINVSVAGSEMKVNRPDTETAIRRSNYRQRMMELDVADRSTAQQQFSVEAESLKAELFTLTLPDDFTAFICSPAGDNVLDRLLDVTRRQERDILAALDKLIDVDTEIKLGRVRHVYRDLVRVWCYIVRLAVASRVWGELMHAASGEYPRTSISEEALKSTFKGLGAIQVESIERAILHFSSFKEQRHFIDLYFQPLLRLEDATILIAASYIVNSRFDRNLISMVARERNDSLAAKGRRPLRALEKLFEAAGYRCFSDVAIYDDAGRLITDLDLLAYQDQDVFCFQSKVLSIPDSPYEYWRVDQTLLSAAAQMDRVLEHQPQLMRACLERDASFPRRVLKVTPYLITDVMVHSGFSLNGYEVIDFDYLSHLLNGAHLSIIDIMHQRVVGMLSQIEGKFPTPDELRRLITSLSISKAKQMKDTSLRRIEHGGWAIVMDAKGFV